MATINKKLIHFNSESEFTRRKENGDLKDSSIVFVGENISNDAANPKRVGKKIYTHGEIFNTHFQGSEGIEVEDDTIKIAKISDYIMFFETESLFEAYKTKIGGEANLASPCVIYVLESNSLYYHILDEEESTDTPIDQSSDES